MLCEFPIGSYVKLNLALAAILVGGLKCQTQFWKGTTQGSLQQSLVEIGSVVSEKIFFINFISLFFSISSLVAILVGSRDHRTQFWKEATQGAFNQSLVAIGPVVSEEKIKMWNVDGRTKSDAGLSIFFKCNSTSLLTGSTFFFFFYYY